MKTKRMNLASMALAMMIAVGCCCPEAKADNESIDRYKIDFYYQGVGYQILSETEHTVAVCQNFDWDSTASPEGLSSGIDADGRLMADGLEGYVVVIPEKVYDESMTEYTVTDLAGSAINQVSIGTLVLPASMRNLSGGIVNVKGMSTLYLPSELEELDGIRLCESLKSLYIPSKTECIQSYSLMVCGLEFAYLPPSVKTLGDMVLSYCGSLKTAMLSGVEIMGKDCFKGCGSFVWANLPESLRSMDTGCFNGCENLKIVTLPWSEIEMDDCFNGCPSVNCIEVLSAEPYPFPNTSFMDVDRTKCRLVVPEGSVDLYKAAEGWKEFYLIEGNPSFGVSGVETIGQITDFRVFADEGNLTILNPNEMDVKIYDLKGNMVAATNQVVFSKSLLSADIYIAVAYSGGAPVARRKFVVK